MPLVMSKDEWSRLAKWKDQSREDADVAQKREYVRYLDKISQEMTKTWPNSLENVNKRNEELRRERNEAAEQANAKFYKRYLKRQKEEQQRLMYSARDMVFKNKDAPKFLLSAVIETVIQKERMEQVKFLEQQRRQQAEKKRQDDDEIIAKAKEWHELMELRKKRRFDANKQHQKEILYQAHEVAERNRLEYETELNLQKIDNIQAKEQMDAIKKFERKFKAAEKARIWADMEQSRQEMRVRRREQAARDKMDNDLIHVLLNSRARIERRRAKTEQDVRNEKLRILESISQKLESGDAAHDAKEQAILNKAVKEKEANDEARRQADVRKKESFKQQRIAARQQFLKDEEQRVKDFNTMRQWEIMNRFKNAELCEEFQEKLHKEKERKTKEYKEDILRLWKEREDREAQERAETRYFYGELAEKKIRDADNKLLSHAKHLLDEAKTHARPVYPLERAIDRYCKQYRLYPMPELPTSMQVHLKQYAPRDNSSPDPDYTEPAPPPPDLGPDAPDDEETDVKSDALHNSVKVDLPEVGDGKKEESIDDYKRVGRANGLQRRHAQLDISLPPIAKVACKTDNCRCDL